MTTRDDHGAELTESRDSERGTDLPALLSTDIRYEFAYRFCSFVLPVGSLAVLAGGLTVPFLLSGAAMWWMLLACSAVLVTYEYLRRVAIGRVTTPGQLNALAAALLLPGAMVNFAGLLHEPDVVASIGTFGVMIGSGLAFQSTRVFLVMLLVAVGSWAGVTLTVAPAPASHWVQLGVLAPILAFGIRQGARRGYQELAAHRRREIELVADLRSTVDRLREERANREKSDLLLYEAQRTESLGVLAAGVAHDFNNLLLAIIGFAESAAERPDAPESRDAAEQIKKTALRAATICDQMLTYAGQPTNDRELVDLNELVEDLTPLLEASIDRGLELDIELGPSALVSVDEGQVRQAVMNVVLNAAEATPSGVGKITIATGATRLSTDPDTYVATEPTDAPGYRSVRVTDSGIGLDATTRRQIFDPYFTSKTSGHGLGLAVTLGIMKNHGGGVRVTSEVGRGTTVELVFPEHREAQTVQEPAVKRNVPELAKGHVLLVDDERLILDSVSRMLQAKGFSVVCADGGPAALEAFAKDESPFDLVIIDYSMPGMNGLEVMEHLRCIEPECRVILSSGYLMGADSEPHTAEANALLEKPYAAAELVDVISGVMHGSQGRNGDG